MIPRAVALLALVAAGCATTGGGADVRSGIMNVLRSQVEAWNRGDLEGFMDGYWESPELIFTSGARVQQVGVVAPGEPAGAPVLRVAEAESDRVYLLAHFSPLSLTASR